MIGDMELTSLELGGAPLEYVDRYKYLGVSIDAHMTFQPFVKQVPPPQKKQLKKYFY